MKIKKLDFITIAALSVTNPAIAAVTYYCGVEMLSEQSIFALLANRAQDI